jgi:hypothetical protein
MGRAGLASSRCRPVNSALGCGRGTSLDIENTVPLAANPSSSSLPPPRGGMHAVAPRRSVAGRPQSSRFPKGASRTRAAPASGLPSATGHRCSSINYRCLCEPLQTQCNTKASAATRSKAANPAITAYGARFTPGQGTLCSLHAPAPRPQPNPSLNRSANGSSPWPRSASGSSCTARPRRPAVVARLAPR